MSISDREMESFNQKTHEIMESLKVSQKRLEEMIVTLKGPLGAARMNSNIEEIGNFTEIMDNLKKLQRSMIADSNSLSFIKDDLETAKETSEANAKLREEEQKKLCVDKSVDNIRREDPRGTYRRQREIEEGSNDCLSNIDDERRSEGRHRNHPRQYEGKREDERRSGERRGNYPRQYEGKREDERRSGDRRGNHQRQNDRYERGNDKRSGGAGKNHQRPYEGAHKEDRRSEGGRKYHQRR